MLSIGGIDIDICGWRFKEYLLMFAHRYWLDMQHPGVQLWNPLQQTRRGMGDQVLLDEGLQVILAEVSYGLRWFVLFSFSYSTPNLTYILAGLLRVQAWVCAHLSRVWSLYFKFQS
jgi:hypothetical protein